MEDAPGSQRGAAVPALQWLLLHLLHDEAYPQIHSSAMQRNTCHSWSIWANLPKAMVLQDLPGVLEKFEDLRGLKT